MTTRYLPTAVLAALSIVACTSSPSQADPAPGVAAARDSGRRETAIIAAGCFWGVEHWMLKAPGVVDAEVGYVGGTLANVDYEQVSTGTTGHAEAVRVVFDPARISYEEVLVWFFKIHDPTTKNRQGNDDGPQYRSAIFPLDNAQRAKAAATLARVSKSGAWHEPLTTTIEAPRNWVTAEDYHQDYLVKHPGGYDNHWLRPYLI
jgi:methionine-S-sulfoxide reductase